MNNGMTVLGQGTIQRLDIFPACAPPLRLLL